MAPNKKVDVNNKQLPKQAYARVKADLEKLAPDELLQINLDVPHAVSTILGALPKVKAFRARIVKELPSFDIAPFDKLEDYALALSFTHVEYLTTQQPPDELPTLVSDATRLREQLRADANALAQRKLIDVGQLAQLRGGNGRKNLAHDLHLLSGLLEKGWSQISGRSCSIAEELQLASRMATRLINLIRLREDAPRPFLAATDARMRAFTRLTTAYEDARRAVSYLCAKKAEADRIAPSIYAGRTGRRKSKPRAEASPPAARTAAGAMAPSKNTPVARFAEDAPVLTRVQTAAAMPAIPGTLVSKGPFLPESVKVGTDLANPRVVARALIGGAEQTQAKDRKRH